MSFQSAGPVEQAGFGTTALPNPARPRPQSGSRQDYQILELAIVACQRVDSLMSMYRYVQSERLDFPTINTIIL